MALDSATSLRWVIVASTMMMRIRMTMKMRMTKMKMGMVVMMMMMKFPLLSPNALRNPA